MTINEKCDFLMIALYELEISGERGMINAMETLTNHDIYTEDIEIMLIKNKLDYSGYAVTQIKRNNEFRAQITAEGLKFYKTSSFKIPNKSIESQRTFGD